MQTGSILEVSSRNVASPEGSAIMRLGGMQVSSCLFSMHPSPFSHLNRACQSEAQLCDTLQTLDYLQGRLTPQFVADAWAVAAPILCIVTLSWA